MDASDGLHLSLEAHKLLGDGIARKLVELIGEPPELPERPGTIWEQRMERTLELKAQRDGNDGGDDGGCSDQA